MANPIRWTSFLLTVAIMALESVPKPRFCTITIVVLRMERAVFGAEAFLSGYCHPYRQGIGKLWRSRMFRRLTRIFKDNARAASFESRGILQAHTVIIA
ncbi:hypothetical protein N7471_009523 [Penicillium samsonianum]|uniref:uncharacterized protein n=1 Tax=Penicillium samsonianum TaxID=1882272 RepID=UPI0025476DE3|nr:uncharacterized protein N7471_009523 [Penicillium samsonianum]KAJ6128306.1 hypothetical protein N7471_009523 [Penicillium samsonianum]